MSSVSDYAFVSKAVDLFNQCGGSRSGQRGAARGRRAPARVRAAAVDSVRPPPPPQSRPGALERGPTEREPCSVPCVAMKV